MSMERITLKDIYQAVNDLRSEISINYAKIDSVADLKSDVDELKKDVKSLNGWKWWFTGASAAVGATVSMVLQYWSGNK